MKWQKYEIKLCSTALYTKSSFLTMLLLISNCSHTGILCYIISGFVCVCKGKAELKTASMHTGLLSSFFNGSL